MYKEFCDRCGKEISKDDELVSINIGSISYFNAKGKYYSRFEVCKDCANRAIEYLGGDPKCKKFK